MKEGYLQLKIRDLNDAVKELEQQIEDKKKEVEQFTNRLDNIYTGGVDFIKPFLEVDRKLTVINEHIEATIRNKMDDYFNKFEKVMFSKYKKNIDHFTEDLFKKLQKQFETDFSQALKVSHQEVINCHTRVDKLVEILNNRGYTNISTIKMERV